MPNAIKTKDIGLELIRIIDGAAGLNLVTAELGTLEDYFGAEDIGTLLPALLVAPYEWEGDSRGLGGTSLDHDFYRILYVQEMPTGTETVPTMLDKAQAIVDALSAKISLPDISTSPIFVVSQRVVKIEWMPEENTQFTSTQTPAKAIAIIDRVTTGAN